MSALNVFKNAAGQGGLAAERALSENAGFIMGYFNDAQPRQTCLEVAPSTAPGIHI